MKITKIKLVNWHIFSNETITFNHNLLITGENGCGKSTLMDAIYYLMSGGDDKHFNQAAGQGGNRTLETYMRCKVGNEGQEYIRQGSDVISYIAFEMVSEQTNRHSVLGVCLEIVDNNKPKRHFFYIPDSDLRDTDFINGTRVYSYREFKINNQNIPGYYDFANFTNKEIKQQIGSNIFKIKDYKRFYDLLQKAISFNPITEVSSFVNEFLLEDSQVDLSSLITQIHNYQDFKKMIEKEEEKINFLDTFIKQSENYAVNQELIDNLKIILNEKQIANYNNLIDKINKKITQDKEEKVVLESKLKQISDNIKQLTKDIADLERNDDYKLMNESIKLLEVKQKTFTTINNELMEIIDDIEELNKIGVQFEFKHDLTKDIQKKDYLSLKDHLEGLNNFLEDLIAQLYKDEAKLEEEKNNLRKEIEDVSKELDILKKGKNNYKPNVELLIDILTTAVKKHYPYDEVYIRPFCEYLEVEDEEWTNALEGYLGNQRFDLIIDPKYFDIAAKEYERVKDEFNIFGVGIVNVSAIKETEVKENSLYTKLIIDDIYADKYAKKLLGKVICCNDVLEAKQYKSSITKEVMIYKNCVLKACNPDVYKKPFLGVKSRLKRIDILEKQLNELKEEYHNILNELDFVKSKSATIRARTHVTLKDNLWQKLLELENEIRKLEDKINELKQNESLLANARLLEKYNNDIKEQENESEIVRKKLEEIAGNIRELEINKNTYSSEITRLNNDLFIEKNKNKNIELLDSYRSKYETHKIEDLKKIIESSRNYNIRISGYITQKITYYSSHFNPSLSASIENIKDFINEYYKLKNEEIVNYKEKAESAFRTAEESFKRDFVAKLKEKIDGAKSVFKRLNKKLSQHKFGTDEEVFSFENGPSKDKEFAEYYRIISNGESQEITSLFDSEMDSRDREIMKQLFDKISTDSETENSEKLLREYLDYRNYMSYDIKIVDKNNKISHFSQINKEKSGGETQTPFYIIMAACFEELLGKNDSVCCIILDEAFNNMDEDRIKSMMNFYKQLKIQVIIIVPTIRVPAIFPYCDSIIGILKSKNKAKIAPIDKNEKI